MTALSGRAVERSAAGSEGEEARQHGIHRDHALVQTFPRVRSVSFADEADPIARAVDYIRASIAILWRDPSAPSFHLVQEHACAGSGV